MVFTEVSSARIGVTIRRKVRKPRTPVSRMAAELAISIFHRDS